MGFTTSGPQTPPAVPPFGATAAFNGASVDGVTGKIQFGQDVGAVGNPGGYVNQREIPNNGFFTKFLGTGNFLITQNNRPDSGQKLQVDTGVRIENGFGGVIDLTPSPLAQLTLTVTNAFVFINGNNATVQVGMEDVTLTAGNIGNIDLKAKAGVVIMRALQNANVMIGSVVDNGKKLQVNGSISQNDVTAIIHAVTAMNNGAGAALGTLTNAPAVGNPTKWIPIDDAGTTRFIPAW